MTCFTLHLKKEKSGNLSLSHKGWPHNPVSTSVITLSHWSPPDLLPSSCISPGNLPMPEYWLAVGHNHLAFNLNSDYPEVILWPLGEVMESPPHAVLIDAWWSCWEVQVFAFFFVFLSLQVKMETDKINLYIHPGSLHKSSREKETRWFLCL